MTMPSVGFIKLMRSGKALALMEDPNAFTLASVIAWRAQRTNAFNLHGLEPGEALVGDCERYGMSPRLRVVIRSSDEQEHAACVEYVCRQCSRSYGDRWVMTRK